MQREHYGLWIFCSLTLGYLGGPQGAMAQIVPDGTLPVNSIVTPDGNTLTIEGGTAAGGNLFHSFGDFNVPTDEIAHFNNGLTIDNIITRVTGGNVSNIDGLIRANGTANLFLINPAGLMFGENASLDIGGSFLGSTASALQFEDGSFYSAVDVDTLPLLSVNVPIGLQFGPQPGAISVEGGGHNLRFEEQELASGQDLDVLNREERPSGLQVQPDRTLALVGGDIDLRGGNLTAEGGRIELGSVAGNSTVTLAPIDRLAPEAGWQLGYEGVGEFGNIRFSQAASIDTSGPGAGEVQVQGRSLSLTDGSAIVAVTLGDEAGENVTIRTTEFVEFIGTTEQRGPNDEIIEGTTIQSGVMADVGFAATGDGANVSIHTESFQIEDGGWVSVSTRGAGNAGDLTIEAPEVIIRRFKSFILLTGDEDLDASGLFSQVSPGSTGTGGTIEIDTDRLLVDNGAIISIVTQGQGRAGRLEIRATDSVEIITRPTVPGDLPRLSSLRAAAGITATGNGGDLTIHTDRLIVVGGSDIATTTLGIADAGNLTVIADRIELSGFTFNKRGRLTPSRLEAQSNRRASGDAGNLTVDTEGLSLSDGAKISVEGQGTGNAGDLSIQAQTVFLDRSSLSATTVQGNEGNITFRSADLRLRDGSSITTNATGASTGGNITIETDTLAALENSDITANAEESRGGRVTITAQGILGTQFRENPTPESDITATSALGPQFNGTVNIQTPDVDPSNGLLELPDTPIDATSIIGRHPCLQEQGSELVNTGRGGLPPTPRESLRNEEGFVELVKVDRPNDGAAAEEISSPQPTRLVEAQGWEIGPDGEVILTANPSTVTPHGTSLILENSTCRF